MATKATWLGHACVLIRTERHSILIDPFLSGQPQPPPISAQQVSADFILLTHGHVDHVGDTVSIARRTGATVISNYEIISWLQNQGLSKVHPMHIGGSYRFAFGRLKLTPAMHGSGLPDGSYGGNPCGFLLFLDGCTIYHAGDTGLFGDMALLGEAKIDLAFLPIGDNFTMGPEDALRAVKLLQPRRVVPIHYNTWDLIRQDAQAWAEMVRKETSAEPIVLAVGSSVEL
ncbi:MAG: metal-dependent hydrolase [Gemmatales bacterium]|nr:metal-dependent hydrolase [Gemmatales bacterium]MDW7994651.1 metal-dependent hydrolase [Gemmatales bacterium]